MRTRVGSPHTEDKLCTRRLDLLKMKKKSLTSGKMKNQELSTANRWVGWFESRRLHHKLYTSKPHWEGGVRTRVGSPHTEDKLCTRRLDLLKMKKQPFTSGKMKNQEFPTANRLLGWFESRRLHHFVRTKITPRGKAG